MEGAEVALKLSGLAAKNFAVFVYAVLKDQKKTRGKTRLVRMLKEQRPLKFFTLPQERMKEFAREAKSRGLLFVPIRSRQQPGEIEIAVFADDAAKVSRVLDSLPVWIVSLLGVLLITVLSFVMALTVYGRMFKLMMYTAIAPVPLACFAGEPTGSIGKSFLRSYAGVCLEGAMIALACVIFSFMAASPPAVDPNASAVTAVWGCVGELAFNLLVLVGAVRMSDRVVKEMMGL